MCTPPPRFDHETVHVAALCPSSEQCGVVPAHAGKVRRFARGPEFERGDEEPCHVVGSIRMGLARPGQAERSTTQVAGRGRGRRLLVC